MCRSIISEIISDTKSTGTVSTSNMSSLPSASTKKKCSSRRIASSNVDIFKGGNPDLFNKVFVIGGMKASEYDDAYKLLITYLVTKFNHRISGAFELKDANAGRIMLIKPNATNEGKSGAGGI